MTWWENLIVHAAPAVLQSVFKNPKTKAEVKHIALDVFTSAAEAYVGDPDFAAIAAQYFPPLPAGK